MSELANALWLGFKHLAFFVGAMSIASWISLQFMSEVKEIPFIPQNLCDRTYYKSDSVMDSNYDVRTTDFSVYMSKDKYENRRPEQIHWAYGPYLVCIDNVNEYLKIEGAPENLKKKGRFPPSCSEYSKCGGGLVAEDMWETAEIKSKEGNYISLSSSSGRENYKISLYELEESGEWNKPFVIILIFFYLTFVFGWRYVKKKLSDI